MSSLFPRSRPAFRRWQYVLQTMAGPGERSLKLGISDSEYELSYICALGAGSAGFCSSGYASSKLKWLKGPNTMLFDNEICTMNDGKPFSETARLTSSHVYDFMYTFILQ